MPRLGPEMYGHFWKSNPLSTDNTNYHRNHMRQSMPNTSTWRVRRADRHTSTGYTALSQKLKGEKSLANGEKNGHTATLLGTTVHMNTEESGCKQQNALCVPPDPRVGNLFPRVAIPRTEQSECGPSRMWLTGRCSGH